MREKAKIVLLLIEDEEKRKEERDFAMKTKDKLAKAPNGKTHKPRAIQKTGIELCLQLVTHLMSCIQDLQIITVKVHIMLKLISVSILHILHVKYN